MGVGLPSQEVNIDLLGRLCRPVPGGCTYYLVCLPWGVMILPCLGGARGLRGAISLTVHKEGRSLG